MPEIYGSFAIPSPIPENATVYNLTRTAFEQTDTELLGTIESPSDGTYAIITTIIDGEEYGKTAYIYKNDWIALTGNVDADKVIIRGDTTLAGNYSQVGNVTKAQSGSGTLKTDGMTVSELLRTIFTKREQPNKSNPSAGKQTLTVNGKTGSAVVFEVGTVLGNVTFNAVALNPGSYTYGPATGVTSLGGKITASTGDEITTAANATGSHELNATLTDGMTVTYASVLNYSEGVDAKDNLGDVSNPLVKIDAGSLNLGNMTIKGYRQGFYGALTSVPATVDSDFIRSLTGTNGAVAAGKAITMTIPEGAKYVVIAYPDALNHELASVKDKNAFGTDIVSSFVKQIVAVKGANDYTAVNYKVYIYAPDAALGANTYNVTI